MRSKTLTVAFSLAVSMVVAIAASASPALAEPHPYLNLSFGRSATEAFANPNGIAIDQSTGDVYVAAIGDDTVYKFNTKGEPVNFASLGSNALTGTATPAGSFAFPAAPRGTPAAIAVDNSTSPADPSAGDLYVMDAGHGVIDKYSPEGKYLSQITGFAPATGVSANEPLGLAVDTNGVVRVELSRESVAQTQDVAVDEFDDSPSNHLIATQTNPVAAANKDGLPFQQREADGFAVGPTGDDFLLYGGSCSCTAKVGQQLAGLGALDNAGSGDVALAADPATGHVYVESESLVDSVTEWDTGAINGGEGDVGAGTPVSSFGSSQLSGSSGQGGIAVNASTGDVYVSNPGNGLVYVFGSDAPAVTLAQATGVSKEGATLSGTVNPLGVRVASCEFEYGVAEAYGRGSYEHTVSCAPQASGLGSGTSPVGVSASIGGLTAGLLYRYRLKTENTAGTGESSGLFGTLGEGFGVKHFESSFLNENGSPDTQAGSHPYEYVNSFEFNSHFERDESNADSRWVQQPDGAVKDLYVDLPPGVVGDPNATAKKCTLNQLDEYYGGRTGAAVGCPKAAALGHLALHWSNELAIPMEYDQPVFNMVPPRGVALQLGLNYVEPRLFINNGLLAGGDYPIQASIVNAPPAAPVLQSRLTIWGEAGREAVIEAEKEGATGRLEEAQASLKPFLTLPTGCHGPLRSTIEVDSYEEPGRMVKEEYVSKNASGTPVGLTGCAELRFPPSISVEPDTTDASSSSGLTVGVDVPQAAAQNPHGLAESSLRDTTVALPAGVAINPSGGDGLEACSEGLAGFEAGRGVNGSGFEEFNPASEPRVLTPLFSPAPIEGLLAGVSLCPDGSKIGTVKIKTPLLEHELEGAVYLATQDTNPFGSLLAMYLMVEDPVSGSTIKLTGEVRLCEAAGEVIDGMLCEGLGQIVTTFKNTPDLPFEELQLHFFGGERAPLATPSRCGTYTTQASFVPWDGNGPVNTSWPFQIDHGPGGGPCSGASLPFSPSLTGGATNLQAGAFSPFTLTMNRKDGEQNLQSVQAHLPPGLAGILSNVELCPEPQANLGECGANSLIGETTVSVGVGNAPFTVSGGKFYLTGPYNGTGACTVVEAGCAPFGVSFVVPAKAGPFDLADTQTNHPACDCVLVRGKIEVNPETAAITITSNPPGTPDAIPTSIAGIPLEIQHINATTTRGDFQFNPTSCNKMEVTGTIHSSEGALDTIGVPFQVTNCASLAFAPKFTVSTRGKTSRSEGASLSVKLTYPSAPFGSQANIARVKVELPEQLPSRLTTLHKACTKAQFDADPAGCPAASIVGHAKAITPLVPVPLEGPAYFVSNGGEAFPNLIVVLQGYGVTIDLVGDTFISKAGITSSTFKTIPDAPVGSFELTLPEGPYSALAANTNLCSPTTVKRIQERVKVRVHGHVLHRDGHTLYKTKTVKKAVAVALTMPTEFAAQNGATIHQNTPIAVTGCTTAKQAKNTRHKTGGKPAHHKTARR